MTKEREIASKFHNMLQKLLSRQARHVCMYPGCSEPAINAHAISKEHSLREIAEAGKVYSPASIRMDNNCYKDIKFKRIGLQEATTFKGFCQSHDALFATLDNTGITTVRDVFLQLYRSLASELFLHSASQQSELHAVAEPKLFNDVYEQNKTLSTAKAVALFHDLITDFPNSLASLPKEDSLRLTPFSEKSEMDSVILLRRVRFKCQVALHKKFTLRRDGQYFDTFVFVIPSDAGATLLMLCSPDDANQLLSRVRTDLDTLAFIEACMMQDGHWWLAPSVVEGWSQEKLELIENDYWFFYERGFLVPYDVSLFDHVRSQLCQSLPANLRQVEIAKIKNLPAREEFVFRQLRHVKKVFEDQQHINNTFQ